MPTPTSPLNALAAIAHARTGNFATTDQRISNNRAVHHFSAEFDTAHCK
jgi:hypothetical protein